MNQRLPDVMEQGNKLLTDLSNQFLDTESGSDEIKSQIRKLKRQKELFFIPSEPVGRFFVDCKVIPPRS
jgi:hypothetical protein